MNRVAMNKFLAIAMAIGLISNLAFAEDSSIHDLTSLDQLRETFQKDAGKIRIITLLSPT